MKKIFSVILTIILSISACNVVFSNADTITLAEILETSDVASIRIKLPDNGEEKSICQDETLEKFFKLIENVVITKCDKPENADFDGMYIDALKNDGKLAGFMYITNDGYADKYSMVMSRIPAKAYAFKNSDEAKKLMTEIISLTAEGENKNYSEWSKDYVLRAGQKGICSYIDNTISATRLEFCEMLYNTVSSIKKLPDESNFSVDVFSDCDSFAVMYLYDIGVVKGASDSTFMPEEKINREQAASMVYRLAKYLKLSGFYEDYRLSSYMFADCAEMSDWAVEAISQLKAVGIMNGIGNDLFKPKEFISLEQSAALVVKLCDKVSISE